MDSQTTALRNKIHLNNKRVQKSCAPCRARKLKCNRASPCIRCIKSEYPELCLYDERARPSASAASGSSPYRENQPQSNEQSHTREQPPQLTDLSRQTQNEAINSEQGQSYRQNGSIPYLGTNSLPQFLNDEATVIGPSEHATRQGARDALMPMLGSTPLMPRYPFYGPSESAEEEAFTRLSRSLPSSKDIIR